MIANYYQRTFTIIQSKFWGFLYYKDIIQQKQKNIILNQNNDMLNYNKCTLRTDHLFVMAWRCSGILVN